MNWTDYYLIPYVVGAWLLLGFGIRVWRIVRCRP